MKLYVPHMHSLHDCSSHNRYAIGSSAEAGCFYCHSIWTPAEEPIKEFCDKDKEAQDGVGNATALCPYCSVDSVICTLNVGPITHNLLRDMHTYWFTPRRY